MPPPSSAFLNLRFEVTASPPPSGVALAWMTSSSPSISIFTIRSGMPAPSSCTTLVTHTSPSQAAVRTSSLPLGPVFSTPSPSCSDTTRFERVPGMVYVRFSSWWFTVMVPHEAMNGAMLSGGFPPPSTSFGVTVPTAGMPPSPLAPLPPPVNWDDLDDLFARATDDADYDAPPPSRPAPSDEDGVDRDVPGDPLCLSPPMVSAMAAVRVDGHLSPFELDKRPNGSSSSPQTTMAGGLSGLSPNAQPPEKLLHPPAAPPKPADADNFDETLTLKEADYSAFIETLLAPDPAPIQVATVAV